MRRSFRSCWGVNPVFDGLADPRVEDGFPSTVSALVHPRQGAEGVSKVSKSISWSKCQIINRAIIMSCRISRYLVSIHLISGYRSIREIASCKRFTFKGVAVNRLACSDLESAGSPPGTVQMRKSRHYSLRRGWLPFGNGQQSWSNPNPTRQSEWQREEFGLNRFGWLMRQTPFAQGCHLSKRSRRSQFIEEREVTWNLLHVLAKLSLAALTFFIKKLCQLSVALGST